MSDVKAPKKGAAEPKKSEAKTTDVKKTEAAQPAAVAETTSKDKSTDKPADKAGASPKSASQSSISHFSSVSTPEYRAGWNSIFGGSKTAKTPKSKANGADDAPDHFAIIDENIDPELRNMLYKAFRQHARNQGISPAKIKNLTNIEFSIDCKIR